MAFFGAYFSGLQHIFRRYSSNDLTPAVYYGASMRMCWRHDGAHHLQRVPRRCLEGRLVWRITATIWPLWHFSSGLSSARLALAHGSGSLLSAPGDPSVRPMPLK